MHIVFVTIADLPEGGGNTSRLKTLVRALTTAGHDVTILNQHGLGVGPRAAQQVEGTFAGGAYRYVLGTVERGSGFGLIRAKAQAVRTIARTIRDLHAQGRVDLVWFNQLSFYDTFPLTWLARRLGVPTVQSYEDERHEVVTRERLSLDRRLFALNSRLADAVCPAMADGLVVISRYLQEKYARLSGHPERVHVIPTIVDVDAWDAGPEPPGPPVILYAGAFSEQDEVDHLLMALARLHAEGQPLRAVLLGDNRRDPTRLPQLQARVRELGLADLVTFPGFVSQDEVRRQIRAAHILYNVRKDGVWSRSGLSTKLSEYLASGRLVVSSQVGEVVHYLENGRHALLVPATTTVGDIQAALRTALQDPGLRRRLGQGGQQVARSQFDIRVVQKRLEAMLARIAPDVKSQESTVGAQ